MSENMQEHETPNEEHREYRAYHERHAARFRLKV